MANRDDAGLLVQLAQWGTMMGFDEAARQVFEDDFDPDMAAEIGIAPVRKILQFGETIGTLTKNDLLSTELVLDWLWVAGLWSRVAPVAYEEREKFGVPNLYENFEALAKQQSS